MAALWPVASVPIFLFDGIAMNRQHAGPGSVWADADQVHKELAERGMSAMGLRKISLVRPAFDIAFDWALIMVAVSCLYRFGVVAAVPALFVIANRQRALGNLLHEAGHRNLYRAPRLNDMIAGVFLAPALLADLARYRSAHARHHAMLGMSQHDPDYIAPATRSFPDWWRIYRKLLFSARAWLASVAGHLIDSNVDAGRRVMLVGWWAALAALLALSAGPKFAGVFVVSWYVAKATGFHAITTWREMCDHYGMTAGGIYSFTRDVAVARHWRWIVHPHNNGYHLTHHLVPAVPYYRLPEVWRTLSCLPSYCARGVVCTSYLWGSAAVVRCRQSMAPAR